VNALLFVALPYASLVIFVAGLIWRYRARLTISSLSSQILESRWLLWGTIPFHLGVAILLLGHLLPLLAPGAWRVFVSQRAALLGVETAGVAAALLCLFGLFVLFIRRVFSPAVRAGSTAVDLLVLAVLIAQVALGLLVATMHRWGAVWSVGTTVPYLRSLLALRPDPSLVAGVPVVMTAHLAGAWLVLALLPFTRLVHMFALPLGYLTRAPQRVVWMATGRAEARPT
jgi:nitrate reductase gamma subunit